MKRCKKCGLWKPLDDFYREKGCKDGHRPECKQCNLAARKAWYQKNRQREIQRVRAWQLENPERHREKQRQYNHERRDQARADHLKRTFDLTVEEYERLIRDQRGGCATCGRLPSRISLHVDHDHKTHEIRGLLCMQCNNGLGLLQESPELLRDAADYLEGLLEPATVREELHRATLERARDLAA